MTFIRRHQPGHRQFTTPIAGTRPPVTPPKPRRFRTMSDEERVELEREWE